MTFASLQPVSTPTPTVAAVRAAVRLPPGARVAVAMSGGVDSSTVAALLVEAGYAVFGLTARLYDVDAETLAHRRAGSCCAPEDARDARAVAARLGIRHYVLDEREVFQATVIDRFVQAYDRGDTPNPCVECNRVLKFERLVGRARALGAEALATGHYARLDLDAAGRPDLRRAVDSAKDQSYFLHPLTRDAGRFVRFPLGAWTKVEVRAHAARLGVPTAAKPESMDVCFVGSKTARAYVEQVAGARPGTLVDTAGTQLGRHAGLAGFAVGQRHGLGLPATGPDVGPRYVVDKRPDGTVVVGDHEALRVRRLVLTGCGWLLGAAPARGAELDLQIRHRSRAVPARVVEAQGDGVTVEVLGDLFGAGRGQSGVLYAGDRVLGGGLIAETA